MNSLILSFTARILSPAILLIAAYFFLRGHDAPGGGFIAALIGGTWLALRRMAGIAMPAIRFETLIVAGLLTALGVGLVGYLAGGAFLAGATGTMVLPAVGEVKVALSLVFDVGVLLLVVGVLGGLLDYFGRDLQ